MAGIKSRLDRLERNLRPSEPSTFRIFWPRELEKRSDGSTVVRATGEVLENVIELHWPPPPNLVGDDV